MKRSLLVLALVLVTGCAVARGVIGPDPAIVEAAPDLYALLDADTAAHPENAARNEAARRALEGTVSPPNPIPPLLDGAADAAASTGSPLGLVIAAVLGFGAKMATDKVTAKLKSRGASDPVKPVA